MSFENSILFGSEGSYNIFGHHVIFKRDPPKNMHFVTLDGAGIISDIAKICINSGAFRLATLGYAHLFVHEMGHAMAAKHFTNEDSDIAIYTGSGTASTFLPIGLNNISAWKNSTVEAAGPVADVAFSSCVLAGAAAMKDYLPYPVALTLGAGAVFWISGELLYAFVSASKRDKGDFGQIAARNKKHLAVATAALVSQCTLGVFAAIELLS